MNFHDNFNHLNFDNKNIYHVNLNQIQNNQNHNFNQEKSEQFELNFKNYFTDHVDIFDSKTKIY